MLLFYGVGETWQWFWFWIPSPFIGTWIIGFIPHVGPFCTDWSLIGLQCPHAPSLLFPLPRNCDYQHRLPSLNHINLLLFQQMNPCFGYSAPMSLPPLELWLSGKNLLSDLCWPLLTIDRYVPVNRHYFQHRSVVFSCTKNPLTTILSGPINNIWWVDMIKLNNFLNGAHVQQIL